MAVVVDRSLIWTKTDLTYYFTNSVASEGDVFNQNVALTEFQKACDLWSEPSGIRFSEAASDDADILITWSELDGASDKLGESQYPKGRNIQINMWFDTAEDWTKNSVTLTAQNFFSVALHELGHALGIKHSGNPSAVMAPFSTPFVARTELTADDKDAAEFLYNNKKKKLFIVNETDANVSWFLFNAKDLLKCVALASGNLLPNGLTTIDPVENGDNKYFVRFTHRGGGNELAGGIAPRESTVALYLNGSNGYYVQIT